jgi:uncharacterized protein (DUF433 family)
MQLPGFLVDHPDGEIRLTGHGIGLYHVVSLYRDGATPEILHEQFPTLPLSLIVDVLAFYRDNQAEVDAYVAGYQADLDRQRAAAPRSGPNLSELRHRIQSFP